MLKTRIDIQVAKVPQQKSNVNRTACVVHDVGGRGGEGPPGSIPNPVVKLVCADGTAGVILWESRSLPTAHNTSPQRRCFFVFLSVNAAQILIVEANSWIQVRVQHICGKINQQENRNRNHDNCLYTR